MMEVLMRTKNEVENLATLSLYWFDYVVLYYRLSEYRTVRHPVSPVPD
jgi:hypothetical protein